MVKVRAWFREHVLTGYGQHLETHDNQNIVDVEAGMAIVECQQSVDRQFHAKVVIFSTKDLLAHATSFLRLEVEDSAEPEVTTLAALVVLGMFDVSATPKCSDTGIDISS